MIKVTSSLTFYDTYHTLASMLEQLESLKDWYTILYKDDKKIIALYHPKIFKAPDGSTNICIYEVA